LCLKNFLSKFWPCETPGFRRCAVETFAVLQYCTALLGSWLPKVRDGLSTLSSRVKKNKAGRLEKEVAKQQPTLSNIPEERMLQVLLFHTYTGCLQRIDSFLNKYEVVSIWSLKALRKKHILKCYGQIFGRKARFRDLNLAKSTLFSSFTIIKSVRN